MFCQRDLQRASWYSEERVRQITESALTSFDRACDRWRTLYRDADTQLKAARQAIDRHARGLASEEERKDAVAQEKEASRQRDLLVGQTGNSKNPSQLEFYPYRYFASEGFLPGYNFPRLPVRAYIPAGDNGEFISRPRVVAIREFAPRNVVYYEGSKFQVAQTRIPVSGIESGYNRVATCPQCGYLHFGDDWQRDLCEHCGTKIAPDSHGNPAKLSRVLTMDTMLTRRRERITCDEEERLKYGYNVTTHFRFDSQSRELAAVTAADGSKLLELSYGDTADIWRINRGLRSSQERGFKLDRATGIWGEPRNEEDQQNLQTEVHLMVKDTCNILLIKPLRLPQQDSEAFLASFQYAMERAIQAVYKLEENELASERLGQGQYLLFWEASEGGAGVLSQILENPNAFQRLAQEALDICHFIEEKDSCTKACYECLLAYRNQFDHPLLDRHLIKSYLDQLTTSTIARHSEGVSREAQYQQLREQTDPNSQFEREFLDELYKQGLKLPDTSQELIPEANVKPDFLYRDAKIAIFCDGSAHDHPDRQEQDRIDRENLKYQAGYHVLTFRYDEDWRTKLSALNSF
jgi:very-short-patch-repair endonuclease